MKKVFNIGLQLMAIAYVLTGCTPSLVTDMFTDKYPPESADDVQVFLVGEELPDSALSTVTSVTDAVVVPFLSVIVIVAVPPDLVTEAEGENPSCPGAPSLPAGPWLPVAPV